jgi:GRIP domain
MLPGLILQAQLMQLTDRGSEESKLNYLKNLMVNYLSSEPAVRGHMEIAIGTVLQFTPDELERIQKKKVESWF